LPIPCSCCGGVLMIGIGDGENSVRHWHLSKLKWNCQTPRPDTFTQGYGSLRAIFTVRRLARQPHYLHGCRSYLGTLASPSGRACRSVPAMLCSFSLSDYGPQIRGNVVWQPEDASLKKVPNPNKALSRLFDNVPF